MKFIIKFKNLIKVLFLYLNNTVGKIIVANNAANKIDILYLVLSDGFLNYSNKLSSMRKYI